MWHAGVVIPVAGELPDESDDAGDFEASNLVREVVEEGERRHHFVVGVVVAEDDVVHLLEGVEGELMASVLGGADAVLVAEAGGPQGLLLLLLPRVVFRVNGRVVFVEGGFIHFEQIGYLWLSEVDVVGEDEAGDFAWFRTGKADQQASLEEDFSDLPKVLVLWRTYGGREDCYGGLEFSSDVQF